jgi:hypothetical protein
MAKVISEVIVCAAMLCCTSSMAAETVTSLRLVVGIPEGLPGYDLSPGGDLAIADSQKKQFTACVAKGLNAKFEWRAMPTKRVIQTLIANEIDMAYPMGFTEQRASQLAQSLPAWQNPDYLVSLNPVDMADKRVRIAARMGSPQHTDYAEKGYSNIAAVYAYADSAKLLARGSVDVVIVPKSVYLAQKSSWPPGAKAVIGMERSSGFYVNKRDPKGLLKTLNTSIERCAATTVSR